MGRGVISKHTCGRGVWIAVSAVVSIVGASGAIAFGCIGERMRMRFPIQSLFSRLLAVFVWSAAAVLVATSISMAQAAPLFNCVAAASSYLEEVPEDSTPLGSRIPIILVHGWNRDSVPAPPNYHTWDQFIKYFGSSNGTNLKQQYKPYRFNYYSNSNNVFLTDLGSALRDVLDCVNTNDLQNFGSKNIVIIGHSMGGLIARSFMGQLQKQGAFAGKKGGERVLRLITLGTPHHGAPLANGQSLNSVTPIFLWPLLDTVNLYYGAVAWYMPNRFDLHWDNLGGIFNYNTYPEDSNTALVNLNNDTTYDNKIIPYAGSIIDCAQENDFGYSIGCLLNEQVFTFPSDGIVPINSAQFDGHSVLRRNDQYFIGYDHTQIAQGQSTDVVDTVLFNQINRDLFIDTSVAYSDLVPVITALSPTTLSPGQNFTINWSLNNQGPAAANAVSTTVIRINQSTTSAGPINNLKSVPTKALASLESVSQSVTLSAPLTQGTYYVWIIADNSSAVTNQGPNTGNDLVHSIPITVTAPGTSVTVSGINTSYPTTTAPFQPTINLTGSGFSSVQQISWTCTMPNGTSCGAIKPWTPSNWSGKFTLTSDNAATIKPMLLVPGDPVGTYQWAVTFANATQSLSKSFSVTFTSQGTYSTSIALGAAPNLSTFGQPVTFTASVISSGGTPTGIVQYNEGGTILGVGTLSNGIASISRSDLIVGTHTVTAAYSGATGFSQSTSNGASVTVQSPSTALIVTPSSGSISGQYGGPYSTLGFQVSTTTGSTNFTVAQTPYWLDASTSGGPAGPTPTAVSFSVNATGKGLSPGVYTGEIFFSIYGGGVGSVFRTVTLTVTAPPNGALQVSQGDIFTSGPQLGPFLPDTFIYQLSATSGSVGYSITNWPSWLTPLTTSGTVTTSPTSVTFLVNSSAQLLAPGTYGPTSIAFTNTTNGQGNTTRNATLTVAPIPTLQVTPATDINTSGNQGGPFAPSSFSYTLNTNTGIVHYSLLYVPSWLDVSSTSGTVDTTGTTVTFTVNNSASSLPAGGYTATIGFINDTDGSTGRGSQTRFATLLVKATGTGPSFQGLGLLPGGGFSYAWGISADGKVVVGQANDPNAGNGDFRAFRWANGSMSDIGALPLGDPCCQHSEAFGANSDGSVIVGDSFSGSISQSTIWTNGTMAALPYLVAGDNFSFARAVNPAGTVAVGVSEGASVQAVRWVNGNVGGLGFLSGYNSSIARGVSSDGSVIVGYVCNPSPCLAAGQAFRWINGTMSGLGFLPGGNGSTAFGVSLDGSVVVGFSVDATTGNHRAFRWTTANGMSDLGISASNNSAANAVNADGSVVVGDSNTTGGGAFRWTAADGARSIADLLTAAGVNFAGWSLASTTGVSADGTVIIGFGTDPSGHQEGWIARLPLPVATLQISPATDISASGNQGGPFSPYTFSYQLSASSGTLDYTITNVPTWLDVSSTSGTVNASGTTITFTVNSSANSFAPNTYSSVPIAFTNVTNGQGNTTRAATLTVNAPAPGSLQVTPSTAISASGIQGGPFSPLSFNYQLSASSGSLNYSITGVPNWLSPSSTTGTVVTSPTTVTFTVNSNANSLAVANYNSTINFTNTTNGQGNQIRNATLAVTSGGGPTLMTRTWVSGGGDDSNDCSRTTPCQTFAGAIDKTAAGGEINCLDASNFGPVTITKSITIDCISPSHQ